MSVRFMEYVDSFKIASLPREKVQLRIGVNSAGKIHLSESSFELLEQHYEDSYDTERRGDVIIKGKGVMETFWVHGRRGRKQGRDVHSSENGEWNRESNKHEPIEQTSSTHSSDPLYRQYRIQEAL
ncbi:hypothetical protein ANCDUO_03761 [Ancylostoma duodenale]|uniref:Guanylate cyclase domain-containing protein n=1 Tax=Ancylostoma duodenale TaxID=51022 RepID=A0A0C2H8Q0_9BILA|nr:hypothetical protein ANCDUO_03761 [Ancylostoma duodenale]